MDTWTMIAIYGAGAGALALLANHSKLLRAAVGWGKFGAKPRGMDAQTTMAAVVAAQGTGCRAQTTGQWRVFRPSIGTRVLPIVLGGAVLVHYHWPEESYGMPINPIGPDMLAVMMLIVAASLTYVWRARVSTNGEVLHVRGLIHDQQFDLSQLSDVEEDALHSYRLRFRDGSHVEFLKTVEGSAELRHMLGKQLDQNKRG